MNNFKYLGCFFDRQELHQILERYDRSPLYRQIPFPHITFAYRPKEIPAELFGTTVTVKVVGYASNGENEALKIDFVSYPAALQGLVDTIAVPHITLSVSEFGASVNSCNLDFKPIPSFCLTGIFGGMDEEGVVHTKI